MKIKGLEKIAEFFEISANVNFASVIPYLGSAAPSFYNVIDGSNNYDWVLVAVAGASLCVGFALSSISYSIYKKVSKDIKKVKETSNLLNNLLIKNAIEYYERKNIKQNKK